MEHTVQKLLALIVVGAALAGCTKTTTPKAAAAATVTVTATPSAEPASPATVTVTATPAASPAPTVTVTATPATVTVTAAPIAAPKPVTPPKPPAPAPAAPAQALTASQAQAVSAARNYLALGGGFSRQGLIDQLSSSAGDGFSVADATAAVDSLNVDWNAQAVLAAKAYLALGSGFSHAGLVAQLDSPDGSQFTPAQAEYGVSHAGL